MSIKSNNIPIKYWLKYMYKMVHGPINFKFKMGQHKWE